tara:strand:- start:3704 stop:4738 length:1035 start_codon:yes stop_codon:yes gene_type:complete
MEETAVTKNNITRKLLLNPETNKRYKRGDLILEGKFKGKVFLTYRFDRPLSMYDKDYWGIKTKVVADTLSRDVSGYKIPTPAVISFSGGRTSAFMLKQILNAYDGKLPEDIKVCFANTGKELPETLDFVRDVQEMWDVDIHWLELQINDTTPIWSQREVTYETASRNGEPFDELITKIQMLPNLHKRICTIEMKIKPIERFMQSQGYKEWYSCLGLRYDEPKRVTDSKAAAERYINITPMYDAKHTNKDVLNYWRKNNFDLNIPVINGKAAAGNCDLCFLKGTKTLLNLMHEKPHLADWWIEKEEIMERTFNYNRPKYIKLLDLSKEPPKEYIEDDSFTCFCHD